MLQSVENEATGGSPCQSSAGRVNRLSRLLLGGLVVVQVVDGALRMGRRRENRPLVFSQDLQPRGDIGGMVLAGLRRDAEVGAEKRRADFGHEFFHGIARIAEALPPKSRWRREGWRVQCVISWARVA